MSFAVSISVICFNFENKNERKLHDEFQTVWEFLLSLCWCPLHVLFQATRWPSRLWFLPRFCHWLAQRCRGNRSWPWARWWQDRRCCSLLHQVLTLFVTLISYSEGCMTPLPASTCFYFEVFKTCPLPVSVGMASVTLNFPHLTNQQIHLTSLTGKICSSSTLLTITNLTNN